MKSLKIKLHGNEYWLLSGSLNESSAIALLNHCDENGEVIELGISFAHYYSDIGIIRFGEIIGSKQDIEVIEN